MTKISVAVGQSALSSYNGDISQASREDLLASGFNDPSCEVHTDMISTSDRTVTAVWSDRPSKIIYQNGEFVV